MIMALRSRTTEELQEAYEAFRVTLTFVGTGLIRTGIESYKLDIARELDARGITTAMTREANK